jgi:hypothetical protein
MAMTYRGWICLDVDGECWGLSTGKDPLHATAAEARASGIAEIERLMEGEPQPERDEQVERFKAEAVAVEVSVRVDSREAGLAAMRWLTCAGLSDERLPEPVESDVPTSPSDVARMERERCIALVSGCTDYLGGYTGPNDAPLLDAFHHGMKTCLNVLRAPGGDLQTEVVEAIGRSEIRRMEAPSTTSGPRYLIEVLPERQSGRGRWWKPDACGYTDDILKAGIYSQAQVDDLLDETSHSRAVPAPGILALTDEQLAAINQFVTACATGWERRSEADAGAIEDAYHRWVAAGRPLVPGRE